MEIIIIKAHWCSNLSQRIFNIYVRVCQFCVLDGCLQV